MIEESDWAKNTVVNFYGITNLKSLDIAIRFSKTIFNNEYLVII